MAVLAAGWFALPAFAGGVTVESENGPATVAKETVVDGIAFLGGQSAEVDGTVKGDLFCAGNDVIVRGTVEGDVLCAGNTVTVNGIVKGDVRVAGNVVAINGTVEGAVSAAGSTVTIAKDAKVGTDVVAWASKVVVEGTIGRDLKGGGASATILGAVGRDVDITAEYTNVASGAAVGGNLTYTSERRATVADGAVTGKTTQLPPVEHERFGDSGRTFEGLLYGALATIIFMTVLTLAIVLLMPRYVRYATNHSWKGFFIAMAVGLLAFLVALPLILLTLISVIGVLVAVFLLVVFLLMSLMAGPLVAYYIGRWVMEGRSSNMIVAALVGSALVGIASIIPIIGFIATVLVYFAGLGMVVLSFRGQYNGGYDTVEAPVAAVPAVATAPKKKTTTAVKKK
jgi:cytoskeletal protein CcmA (bactofilin family)